LSNGSGRHSLDDIDADATMSMSASRSSIESRNDPNFDSIFFALASSPSTPSTIEEISATTPPIAGKPMVKLIAESIDNINDATDTWFGVIGRLLFSISFVILVDTLLFTYLDIGPSVDLIKISTLMASPITKLSRVIK